MKNLIFILLFVFSFVPVKCHVVFHGDLKPIDTVEVVEIGGIKQFVKIQGADRTKPIMLFLHGGPGSSLIPVADAFTSQLKEHFVVVQWDQRETGETLKLNSSPVPLSLDLFQKDASQLVHYLLQNYNRKKLFLVSHSFGSMIGFGLAEKHPDLLYAYVCISGIIDQRKSERLTMDMLNKWAKKTGNHPAEKELSLVHLPFESGEDLYYSQKWLFIHNGAEFASKHDFSEKYHQWLSVWFPMWKNSVTKNLFTSLPALQCPVYFIEGIGDQQKSHYIVKGYYDFIKAPKKNFFWFKKSGHTIFNSEPEKLQQTMIKKILPKTFPN